MGLMSVGMLDSFIPGEAGQAIQGLMPALMGLSAVLPMVTSPMGALAVAVGAAAAGIIYLSGKVNENRDRMIAFTNAIGASTKSIRSLAEFSGKVTAGEYMSKVVQNRGNILYAKSGKTTFGENFMGSESGKALVEQAKAGLANGDSQKMIGDLTNQMSVAIAIGALSKEQAASIIAQLGYELNDAALAVQVRANVTQVVGPDGQGLATSPFVRHLVLVQFYL